MREIKFEELKNLQLDILLSVHDFCMKNGIEYSLAAGTLIGAIRHKGYIPWDDDIDICMTRPNYDKFLKMFNGVYEHLQVLAPELNWNYYAPYANVCDIRTILDEGCNGHRGIDVGVKIDIFPIDGVSNNLKSYIENSYTLYRYNNIMRIKRYIVKGFSLFSLRMLLKKLCFFYITYKSLQKRIHEIAISQDFNTSDFAALLAFDPIAFRAPRDIFDEYIDIDFEGHKVRAVKKSDLFMQLRYGDYMQLPPENMRVPHHGFTAYWKD